jgi:membrane protein implicated in regulation of membrane protease activity
VFAVYLGALLFGGLLLIASVAGVGHDGDAHAGGDGGLDQDHGQDEGTSWLALFGIRFWSFGGAFFGLTGLLLRGLGGDGLAPLVPAIASVVGAGAGLGASAIFRMLSRDTVGQVKGAAALVGREGLLLLPVDRGQRGKVRLAQPGGGHVDMVAESDDDALGTGATVLIVEVRGNVAVVARGPASEPPRGA